MESGYLGGPCMSYCNDIYVYGIVTATNVGVLVRIGYPMILRGI